jgi:hypothetical protein
LDASFGTVGRTLFQANQGEHAKGGALLIRPDQKILVAGTSGGFRLVLLQLNGDGSPDASFGAGGVSQMNVATNFLEVQALAMTPAGKLLVLARSGHGHCWRSSMRTAHLTRRSETAGNCCCRSSSAARRSPVSECPSSPTAESSSAASRSFR